jgi:hypothetical protein
MRIGILALSGALAASTLLAAPAMATDTTPPTDPGTTTAAPAPAAEQARLRYRNSCRPTIATLPAAVEGLPAAFAPGAAEGVYIWHERAGWRVRLTHPHTKDTAGKPNLIEVRGRITSTRKFAKVRTIQLEDKQRGEWVSIQRPNRKVMDFRFVNGGFIDGINFNAGCSGRLGFTVWKVTKDANGKVVRTRLPIFVGSTPTLVSDTTVPALAANAPADVSRVVILRTPVTPVTPVPPVAPVTPTA